VVESSRTVRPVGLGRLAAPVAAAWVLNLYQRAGEAGGCFVPSRRAPARWSPPGSAADPERASTEAARRARGRVRRYCAANRLNRLGTLTYAGAGCHDPRVVCRHVGGFFRGLRDDLGGGALPYLWTAEWHPGGHGLHVHFAVGRFVPRGKIEQAWGRGFVHIKLLSDLPVGSGALAESRQAARYLSKYVGKAFDERRAPGLHRYEVAKGFQPAVVGLRGRSADDVLSQAVAMMGGAPSRSWSSAEEPDWRAAPAVWASWG
jgi:hypothetical protein